MNGWRRYAGLGSQAMDAREASEQRIAMVEGQIVRRGVSDEQVLHAMRTVPRHRFVAERLQRKAYRDRPLPIGFGQTISQPYVVAAMTEALGIKAGDRVLEVGTGCGYQAAVLAEVASEVVSIEVVPQLAEQARERLASLSYTNVVVVHGDGAEGFPDRAPFDGILVACGASEVPPALLEQLAAGGRMVIPIGRAGRVMDLELWQKDGSGATSVRSLMQVRFVPLVSAEALD